MSKRTIMIGIVFLVCVAAAGGYWWYWNQYLRIDVREFDGTISAQTVTTLTVLGYYTADGHPEFQNTDQKYTVSVTLTPQTKIIKTAIHLPTMAAVQANGGSFRMEDQPRDTLTGSLDEVHDSDVIRITPTQNIYHRTSFSAASIEYTTFIYPKE